ncbi:hypothetical protein [Peterkaempfera sp. SMS 1(5)a]|uniref:hypothetical protein n=1 Tax=Peterkaempfera podocarpi TaxID=3232308 RepID=UPI003672EF23
MRHLEEAFGRDISLDVHRRQPDRVAELLRDAGLTVRVRVLRERDEDGPFPELTSQALLPARRPAALGRS